MLLLLLLEAVVEGAVSTLLYVFVFELSVLDEAEGVLTVLDAALT